MSDIFRKISRITESGGECVLITVVDKTGHGPSEVGRRMIVTADGVTEGTVGGGTLELLAIKEAEEVLNFRKSRLKKYLLEENDKKNGERTGMLCGGDVLLFFEFIGKSEKLFVFGAGHVGKNVIRFMEPLDYRLNVIDSREKELNKISGIAKTLITNIDSFFTDIDYMEGGFVLIATHSHDLDYKILNNILNSGVRLKYLGMIASENKLNSMIKKYEKEENGEIDLNLLYSPAGLNLGGSTPAEIALSVISEMQSVRYGIKNTASLSKFRKYKNE